MTTTQLTSKQLFNQDSVKKKFEEMLGKRAPQFITSVLQIVASNEMLKGADANSVYNAAVTAATMNLPLNNNLGFAAIVPYKDRKSGKILAQFQMMTRGFVQLGMRSEKYQTINATVVYEGELTEYNRFTGDMKFDEAKRISDKPIGFVAYFRLLSGFEKYLYMTKNDVMAHGKKYSKSFDTGQWSEVDAGNYNMPTKTVLKQLLSKFGILSIEMEKAIAVDQAVINNEEGTDFTYVDNEEAVSEKKEIMRANDVKIQLP